MTIIGWQLTVDEVLFLPLPLMTSAGGCCVAGASSCDSDGCLTESGWLPLVDDDEASDKAPPTSCSFMPGITPVNNKRTASSKIATSGIPYSKKIWRSLYYLGESIYRTYWRVYQSHIMHNAMQYPNIWRSLIWQFCANIRYTYYKYSTTLVCPSLIEVCCEKLSKLILSRSYGAQNVCFGVRYTICMLEKCSRGKVWWIKKVTYWKKKIMYPYKEIYPVTGFKK